MSNSDPLSPENGSFPMLLGDDFREVGGITPDIGKESNDYDAQG